MCGIAGLVFSSSQTIHPNLIKQISSKLQHRGPDDSGILLFGSEGIQKYRSLPTPKEVDIVFLQQRLSILDLSEAGWQPMSSADNRFHIIFNGEIYNYLELQKQLEQKGYIFKSRSDTEVLLNAYIHWRSDCLNKLVGMFAFAVLDSYKKKVFIARDFFGIKPLYYSIWNDNFAFASEIPPLLEITGVTRKINPQKVYDYLIFNWTDRDEETLFKDIRQLPPAHYLEIDMNHVQKIGEPKRYWKIDYTEKIELSFKEAAQRLRELFLDSINLHLRSDVPVGTALSGGIDSSSIVSAIRYLNPDIEIHAFSYIADTPELNEEYYVDLMGASTNAFLHKIKPNAEDLIDDLEHLINIQGEPFNSTSIYAQYRVFSAVRDLGIKVMLDGQGADELLAGYCPYKGAYLASLLTQKHWQEAFHFWKQTSKILTSNQCTIEQWTASYLLSSKFKLFLRQFSKNNLTPHYLNMSWFSEHNVKPVVTNFSDAKGTLKQAQLYSFSEHGLPRLLRYEDRNSMAFSIESRVPFLTPEIVSFTMNLPEDYLIDREGTSKAVFRSAMRGIVPDEILDRKDKIGFATPEQRWLRQDLYSWSQSILDMADSIPLLKLNSKTSAIDSKLPKSMLWKIINLIIWSETFKVEYN